MRINRSLAATVRLSARATLKKTILTTGLISLVLLSAFATQNWLHRPNIANAATPPDSCFAFSAGTITDYYNNEGNNGANPACPKAVEIPATIGGVAVTSIGNSAFYSNQLTTVTIPNSVTSIDTAAFINNSLTSVTIGDSVTTIGDAAFQLNQLTSVTIPDSVTTIGNVAFEFNQLTSVAIGNSVTTIGYLAFGVNNLTSVNIPNSVTTLYGNPFQEQNIFNEQGQYVDRRNVQLYTVDPSNPNGLQDVATAGMSIVNPAQITTTYKSAAGAELLPRVSSVGNGVASYLESDNPTYNMSLYYHAGASVTLTAPTIAGYQAPSPSSQTRTLVAGPNNVDFVYNPNTVNVDFSTAPTNLPGTTIAPVPTGLDAAISGSDLKIDNTKPCTHISNVALLPASGFTAPDTAYATIGGIDFTLACTTSGGTADISYTLGSQLDLAKTKVYKYNSTTHEATEITSQVSLSNVAGKTVIAYSATDGAANDEDAVQNSAIVDPVYVATETPVVVPEPTPAPVIPTHATPTTTATSLAATGDSLWTLLVVAVGAIIISGLILARRFTRHSTL